MIYLDNAATTYKKPQCVIDAVTDALTHMGNAGRGAHQATIGAARNIYDVREKIATLFNISNCERIAFTNNATESLNIAIRTLFEKGDHIITTVCEHNSVLRPLYIKKKEGVEISFVNTLQGDKPEQGILDYSMLESLVRPNTKAIVITFASNVTGNITDMKIVSEFAKSNDILLVVDASQTAGVYPIDVMDMGIDVLCTTGHKGLMGPQGTGFIYVREGIETKPFKAGGSGIKTFDKEHPHDMPTVYEAGTLNAHGIVGLGAAIDYLQEKGVENIRKQEMELAGYFVNELKKLPKVKLYGNPDMEKRVAIVSINIDGYDAGEVSDVLWQEGEVATRSGGHCAPLMHEALGTRDIGVVRFSLSHYNTVEEIDEVIGIIKDNF